MKMMIFIARCVGGICLINPASISTMCRWTFCHETETYIKISVRQQTDNGSSSVAYLEIGQGGGRIKGVWGTEVLQLVPEA